MQVLHQQLHLCNCISLPVIFFAIEKAKAYDLVTEAEDDDLVQGYTVAANTMQLGSSEFIYLYIYMNLCETKRFDWLKAEDNIIFDLALPRSDF